MAKQKRKSKKESKQNFVLTLKLDTVETMSFKGLQKRAKKTTKNEKDKINSKKRFGKSLANKAPAMFLTILDNKLRHQGTELHMIKTAEAKASQYNHSEDKFIIPTTRVPLFPIVKFFWAWVRGRPALIKAVKTPH